MSNPTKISRINHVAGASKRTPMPVILTHPLTWESTGALGRSAPRFPNTRENSNGIAEAEHANAFRFLIASNSNAKQSAGTNRLGIKNILFIMDEKPSSTRLKRDSSGYVGNHVRISDSNRA